MQNENKFYKDRKTNNNRNGHNHEHFQKGRYIVSGSSNHFSNDQKRNKSESHFPKNGNQSQNRRSGNRNRDSFLRNNNYGFPRVENEPKEERTPSPVLNVAIDDHPRAMVLPFDQKALDDIKPRKYTSGYEIHKINIQLARWLTYDDYLKKLSAATGLEFMDKNFLKVEGSYLQKLKDFAKSRLKENDLDRSLLSFYKYMAYFSEYALENKTAVIFDL